MPRCAMCRRDVASMNNVLENGSKICADCARQFDIIMESYDHKQIREAFSYINTCAEQAADSGVKSCLRSFLANNESILEDFAEEEAEEEQAKRTETPVDFTKKQRYSSHTQAKIENEYGPTKPAISTVFSVLAWITWIGGIISAIMFASSVSLLGLSGFPAFLIHAWAAFITGCIPMAVSYVLRYLAQIAYNTEQGR